MRSLSFYNPARTGRRFLASQVVTVEAPGMNIRPSIPSPAPGGGRFAVEVGRRVRRRRDALGLTRPELGDLSGVSIDALGLIERGVTVPKADTLARVAAALRVPVDALLQPAGAPKGGRTLALDRLIVYLSRRGERDIRMVHDIARGVLKERGKRPKKTTG